MQLTLFDEQEVQPLVSSTRAISKPKPKKKLKSSLDLAEPVDEQVRLVLSRSTVENGVLHLPEQLERSLYESVDETLKRLRGRWVRRATGHVFPFGNDTTATLIQSVVTLGKQPSKNSLALYPTPYEVIDDLVSGSLAEYLDWWQNYHVEWDLDPCHVLEPSAGTGAIADYITERWPDVTLHLVEMDEINIEILKSKGYSPTHADFAEFEPEHEYHAVIMNPPFAVDGDATAYITHISKAFSHLRPCGQLAAIAPPGFTWHSDNKTSEFLNWVCFNGGHWEFSEGAFKESGTMIKTVGIWMKYEPFYDKQRRDEEFNGWPNFDQWLLALWLGCEYDLYCEEQELLRTVSTAKTPLNLVGLPARKSVLKRWTRLYERTMKRANKYGDGFDKSNVDIAYLIRHSIENYC